MARSHGDIIRLWPTTTAFGADVGLGPDSVRKMIARNSIDSSHWDAVVRGAARRGIKTAGGESVTLDLLTRCQKVRGRR